MVVYLADDATRQCDTHLINEGIRHIDSDMHKIEFEVTGPNGNPDPEVRSLMCTVRSPTDEVIVAETPCKLSSPNATKNGIRLRMP